jgi:hypothetical protein
MRGSQVGAQFDRYFTGIEGEGQGFSHDAFLFQIPRRP